MLFNSYAFILVFLPITLAGFLIVAKFAGRQTTLAWLVAASLIFYSWWNPWFFFILAGSIIVNYTFGFLLHKYSKHKNIINKFILFIGILLNITLLIYYKYTDFILNTISGKAFILTNVTLPLAISFFTLQQVAYLVDCYKNGVCERSPLKYALFVTFFPQLIAGPIVHHQEMMPQFDRTLADRRAIDHIVIGLSIFAIGLAKKVLLADSLASYSDLIFNEAGSGVSLTVAEAWLGALCYTFQLYFDFSGYSDMAIGLGFMFGIRLPENFRSPYKATSIISFWRRWHITLSRFLRDYIYIPLGGNRKGVVMRYVNVMVVMAIGGIWHGAGLTFLFWGVFHGAALVINHGWRRIKHGFSYMDGPGPRLAARLLTFVVIVVGWVFFRSPSFTTAVSVLTAMFLGNGISLPVSLGHLVSQIPSMGPLTHALGIRFEGMFHNVDALFLQYRNIREAVPLTLLCFIIAWGMPNTQTLFRRYRPCLLQPLTSPQTPPSRGTAAWRLNTLSGVWVGFIFVLAFLSLWGNSPFLYFQF